MKLGLGQPPSFQYVWEPPKANADKASFPHVIKYLGGGSPRLVPNICRHGPLHVCVRRNRICCGELRMCRHRSRSNWEGNQKVPAIDFHHCPPCPAHPQPSILEARPAAYFKPPM